MLRVLKPEGILLLEFANPFYGIIVELYRRWFLNKNSIYIWPHQTKKLFKGTKIIKKIGTYLPLTQKITKINPTIGKIILKLCERFPFNHLSSEIFYICQKLQ